MITIFKKHFSRQENVLNASRKVFGLGNYMALQVIDQLGISRCVTLGDLSTAQLSLLERIVEQNYLQSNALSSSLLASKTRLAKIYSYRASRHKKGLPARGQRSHGNAKSVRRLSRFKAR